MREPTEYKGTSIRLDSKNKKASITFFPNLAQGRGSKGMKLPLSQFIIIAFFPIRGRQAMLLPRNFILYPPP